ncbi:hypothetical protein KFK09_011465 [Dendrobium nobile]|uniref:Uncharacterized protein n=1 Tax=Dendrobium nobile TaxID=94219 RepID=A0A8T3BG09_DENNO|nr:hypothetical protein KFK09_011465 [Dendrobium nobile]
MFSVHEAKTSRPLKFATSAPTLSIHTKLSILSTVSKSFPFLDRVRNPGGRTPFAHTELLHSDIAAVHEIQPPLYFSQLVSSQPRGLPLYSSEIPFVLLQGN